MTGSFWDNRNIGSPSTFGPTCSLIMKLGGTIVETIVEAGFLVGTGVSSLIPKLFPPEKNTWS